MNEIDSRRVRDFLEIETVASQGRLRIQLRFRFVLPRCEPLDDQRREHQAREDDRQNDSCCDALLHLGGALLQRILKNVRRDVARVIVLPVFRMLTIDIFIFQPAGPRRRIRCFA